MTPLDHDRADEAFRRSEARYRSIIESIPTGVFVYQLEPDNRPVLVDANPAANQILGIDCRLLLHKTIEEAFPALPTQSCPKDIAQRHATALSGTPTVSNITMAVSRGATLSMPFRSPRALPRLPSTTSTTGGGPNRRSLTTTGF